MISADAVTLRTMLCETDDQDWYSFPLAVGDRIRITPRLLTDGVNGMGAQRQCDSLSKCPAPALAGPRKLFEVVNNGWQLPARRLHVRPQQREPALRDRRGDHPGPDRPTPTPNNWSCTVYPSSNVPRPIDDLTTLASTVTVPDSGTVTWVGLKEITFNHGALWNLSFGLGSPDGTQVELFVFDDFGFYNWCGDGDCRLSMDDWAIQGLTPPIFPNDGGTFRPSRNSFAPFEGKAEPGRLDLLCDRQLRVRSRRSRLQRCGRHHGRSIRLEPGGLHRQRPDTRPDAHAHTRRPRRIRSPATVRPLAQPAAAG